MGGNLCNASPAPTACRRWSPPAPRRDRRAQRPARAARSRHRHRPGPATSLAKGEIVVAFLLPPSRSALGRCLSALHPAHRDGHRRGRLRRQPDARRQAASARPRGSSLGAVAPTVLLVEDAAKALIGTQAGRRGAGEARPPPRSAACRPIDDKRGTNEYRIKVAGVLARRAPRPSRSNARGENVDLMAKHHVSTTINGEPASSCASRRRRCSTCCATSSA